VKTARDAILGALAATRPAFGAARRGLAPVAMPPDPEAVLRARVEAAGGRLQVVARRDWVDRVDWPVVLPPKGAAPGFGPADGPSIHSAFPEIPSRGLDRSASATPDFAALDLCILRGDFAVVENGAVWHVPRSPRERRAALLAEHLVVVIEGDALVPSLHQAYERIDLAALSFGWLLCGPSKTADIEQALVLGAHGPRSQSLVWLRDEPLDGDARP
jgi:hypothetical protein